MVGAVQTRLEQISFVERRSVTVLAKGWSFPNRSMVVAAFAYDVLMPMKVRRYPAALDVLAKFVHDQPVRHDDGRIFLGQDVDRNTVRNLVGCEAELDLGWFWPEIIQ